MAGSPAVWPLPVSDDMKSLSPILAAFLGVVACSSNRSDADGGRNEAGTKDADSGGDGTGDSGGGDSGAGDVGGGRQPLCDGFPHLRLWLLVRGRDELRGSAVRVENGHPVIAIDGTCSYWIGGGWTEDALSRDRPFRTGKLSDADVGSVEGSLPVDGVAALADCPPPPAGLFDYSLRDIRSATATATCIGSAPELTAGTRFETAWMTVEAMAGRLWDGGSPMDGALHVSAVEP